MHKKAQSRAANVHTLAIKLSTFLTAISCMSNYSLWHVVQFPSPIRLH